MPTPIATDRHGNILTAVTRATAQGLAEAAAQTPCPLALVVLVDSVSGEVLFGLNTWRREFELPGGIVEVGETFIEAARRELEEETSIRIEELELVGYAHFALTDPKREELGAVHVAQVTAAQPTASDELQEFVWRKPLSEGSFSVSALDDAIAAWVLRTLA